MPRGEKRVFLSYALENVEFARKLAGLMANRGASVFLDLDIRPGDSWPEVLRKEIERATALILLIPSHDATKRNNVWFEAGAAKALGKPVLAVLPPHRRIAHAELPVDIADLLVLDAEERPLESIADMLIQAVPESDEVTAPAN